MGAGASKVDNLPLVNLCRERKDFIRATVKSRYDLATAHVLHLQSLLDVGKALDQFVEEEFEIVNDDPTHEDPYCEEDSHLKFSSELGSLTDCVNDNSKHGDNLAKSRNPTRRKVSSNANGMRKRSSETSSTMYEQPGVIPMTMQGKDQSVSFSTYPQNLNRSSFSSTTSVWPNDVRYAQGSNGTQPVGTTMEFPRHNMKNTPHSSDHAATEFMYNDPMFHQHESRKSFGNAVDSHSEYYNEKQIAPVAAASTNSPAPAIYSWDYLDLFSATDDFNYSYCYQGIYETDQSDLNEVREREGIPDLEDESEQILVDKVSVHRKLEGEILQGPGDELAKTAPSKEIVHQRKKQGKDMKSDTAKDGDNMNGKTENFGVQCSGDNPTKADEDISQTSHLFSEKDDSVGSVSDTSGSRGFVDAVKEIRDEFETTFNHGKEVLVLLEASMLSHQPMGTKFLDFSSWVRGWVPYKVISSEHSVNLSNRSSSRILLMIKDVDGLIEENVDRKVCNLSSTLELIYVWEKKLYEEVMVRQEHEKAYEKALRQVEEKLRVIYDKECKMLKSLDDRGAEPDKIDNVNASIRSLLSNIDVSVTAVDVISRRIHSLRDEELHPQLTELVQGLTRMWSVLSECHLKQFRAIIGIKACVHIANADIRKGSSVRATQKLENDITKWGTCFCNYIDTQKAFVKSLNEWLTRCLFRDPVEAVDDNVSFSPSKIEAPPIFSLCRDWLHAIEGVSETGVREAIHASASKLQSLQEMLVHELNQRLITENLSKDFNKHMRLHYNNNMLLSNFDTPDFTTGRGTPRIDEFDEDLVLMMNRLNEQKVLHEEAVKQVNDAASTILQECLVPIFEALETFYNESLNAYKHVVITNKGEEI